LVARTAIATGYVAFSLTALLALGLLFSTLTDTATSAIGATVAVYIVSQILDGITQLGQVRYAFPTHYLNAWHPMFTENRYPTDMIAGVVVQLVYLAVFGTAAVIWFRRKDIRS
jgi:ABC-2 type transport system permease protein